MMTTASKITVRVEQPPQTSLGEFFAAMRSWLDHRGIIPTGFCGVTAGVFDAQFDDRQTPSFSGASSRRPYHCW